MVSSTLLKSVTVLEVGRQRLRHRGKDRIVAGPCGLGEDICGYEGKATVGVQFISQDGRYEQRVGPLPILSTRNNNWQSQ